jgi:hypothetical protein
MESFLLGDGTGWQEGSTIHPSIQPTVQSTVWARAGFFQGAGCGAPPASRLTIKHCLVKAIRTPTLARCHARVAINQEYSNRLLRSAIEWYSSTPARTA